MVVSILIPTDGAHFDMASMKPLHLVALQLLRSAICPSSASTCHGKVHSHTSNLWQLKATHCFACHAGSLLSASSLCSSISFSCSIELHPSKPYDLVASACFSLWPCEGRQCAYSISVLCISCMGCCMLSCQRK